METEKGNNGGDHNIPFLKLPFFGRGWGKNTVMLLAVTAVLAAIFLPYAGSFGLWDPWETHYGEVARHMTETNDYISTWWGSHWRGPDGNAEGRQFFSKPILLMWMSAIGMDLLGFTEWAIRLGPALIALLGAVAVYLMGLKVWNRRVGIMMAMILGTSPFWFFLSRQAQTDMPFVGLMTVALAFFMMGIFGQDRSDKPAIVNYLLLFGAYLALVLPQLRLIWYDRAFSPRARAIWPGLRNVSMNDFQSTWTPIYTTEEGLTYFEYPFQTLIIILVIVILLCLFGWLIIGINRKSIKTELGTPDSGLINASKYIALTLGFFALAITLIRTNLTQNGPEQILRTGFTFFPPLTQEQVDSGFVDYYNLGRLGPIVIASLVFVVLVVIVFAHQKKRYAMIPWLSAVALLILAVGPVFFPFQPSGYFFTHPQDLHLLSTLQKLQVFKSVAGLSVFCLVLALLTVIIALIVRSKKVQNHFQSIFFLLLIAGLVGFIFNFTGLSTAIDPQTAENTSYGRLMLNYAFAIIKWGPVEVVLYLAISCAVILSTIFSRKKSKGQLYLLTFYLFAGLATLAKGLLGFMLPGAIIFFFILLTNRWRLLKKVELIRGAGVFICVAFPWYIAMLVIHSNAFFQRFFVHDHFKRLASGVHQTDTGAFEHFIKWLGYGLFPWGSFVPSALMRVGRGSQLDGPNRDRNHAVLFLALWFVFAFSLFTLASTKFHHYIFPAVPPLALLVALFFEDLWTGKIKNSWLVVLLGLAFFLILGYDLVVEPQHLKNLCTYQYDRLWVSEFNPEFESAMRRIFAVALLGILALAFPFRKNSVLLRSIRRSGFIIILLSSIAFAVWTLDVYMPKVSLTWSQGGMWNSYYKECTRLTPPEGADEKKIYCHESIIDYHLNWRGETFYSQNEIIPVQDDDDFKYFLESNSNRTFYGIMERSRYCGGSSKKPNMGDDCTGRGSYVDNVKRLIKNPNLSHRLIYAKNKKFAIVEINPLGYRSATGEPDPEQEALLKEKKKQNPPKKKSSSKKKKTPTKKTSLVKPAPK